MGSNTWQQKQDQPLELTREHLNVLLPNKQTYYGGAVYPNSNTYEDEARPDTTYAQPLLKRMYLSPTPSQPKPRIVNECPTGNCFTDRLGSTFLSDVATLAPLGMARNVVRAGINGYKSLNPIVKGSIGGAGGASIFDAGLQHYNGANWDTFDYNQNLKAAAIGGLAGAGNAAVATAAGVAPVSGLNLLGNLNNRVGLDIFLKTAMLKHAGQEAVKSSKKP